ncbi:LuxR C-terminal-related transcriptional regulator [Streptosporangium sp. NPDC000396]|uniref:LuxR C-terminal-related transcriptional regulator n=1 Tax=Streptosporangium sp. NPDC000396 TaxID=3366185 RepID=UPI003684941E
MAERGPTAERARNATAERAENATAERAGDAAAERAEDATAQRAGEAAVERARKAAVREAWGEAYALFQEGAGSELTPDDLSALADAAWWTCHSDESLAARLRAYTGYAAAGAERRAGYTAWMLSYDYQDMGKAAVAAGWLRRAQRHLGDQAECVEHCYLAWSEVDLALARGAPDEALAAARRMVAIAQRCGSRDLAAMGGQLQGGVLLAQGRAGDGLAMLDDVMCAVMAGELSALFTGWIYCLALQQCMAAAELERAAQWTETAMTWCASLPAGNPFHGLCRVHLVEVLDLRGAWDEAMAEAGTACRELAAYDPRVAGEVHYIAGEIHRRRGDLAAAEEAFERAHRLGRDPQPGLALLRLAQGKAEASAAALRLALAAEAHGRLGRSRLLAAEVEVALAVGVIERARAAAGELESIARKWPDARSALLDAMADLAGGAVALAEQDLDRAIRLLRRALVAWLELGVPYEAAQTRMTLAAADRAAGDHDTARLELQAARAAFEQIGSEPEARRASALLAGGRRHLPGELTRREAEVLRLVAEGRTNRSIAAELAISEHTVARHLNNIFAKLDVSSRAAATAFAYTHDLA